ncbi:MAG: starch-binding protein [Erysipelotrichaceae bacterium]|nr:starch-binding protein [Erysipelotrichaceae bacterium]
MKRLYCPKHLALLAILSCLTISACSVTSPSSSTPSAESSSQVTPSSDTSSQEPPASTSQEPVTSSSQEVSSSSESSSSEASSSSSEESSSSEISSSSIEPSSSSSSSSSSETTSSSEDTSSSSEISSSSSESSTSEESSSESSSSSSSQKKTYTVTWKNGDSVLETDLTVEEGNMPSYDGTTPTKAKDAQYTYVFDGWTPALAPVNSDVTYTAKFSSSTNAYEITWKDYDGSLIDKKSVEYGKTPTCTAPTRDADDYYNYTFKAWNPSVASVTCDATYTATYTKRVHTLYFTNNQNWNNLKAYAWGGTGKAMNWPGVDMYYHRTNEFGQAVYGIANMDKYDYVIFNGSGGQTVNIPCDNASSHNAFFLNGQKDGDGHFKVTSLEEKTSDTLRILHCFDWSISTILDNIDDIAAQGFNAIQTSPVQAAKDYSTAIVDTNATWWRYYQPVSLSVANKNGSVLFETEDGDAELKALTKAASEKGIKVIVDVVVNHLGDNGAGALHPSVAIYEPEIYNHTDKTLHTYGSTNDNSIEAIVKGNTTGKDLNTSEPIVQQRVLTFLKELIDDGVSGFRFDAAKHIETPNEQDGCASSFWTNTLGAAKTYAAAKNITIFSYGEILNPAGNTGKRSYGQYISSAGLDAVTDCIIGEKYRDGGTSGYWTGLTSDHNVIWAESHDEYCGDGHITTGIEQSYINDVYNRLARNTNASILLYFARPDMTAPIGSIDAHPDWGWESEFIRNANIAHH